MSNKTYTTEKGSILPLMSLKGKEYMLVAHRLTWLNDVADSFTIDTRIINLTDDKATVKTTLTVVDKNGKVKKTQGTKTEHKKDFNDFLEKAETGSLGRALSMAGFGTQFALQDLDEGDRIVDAPIAEVKKQTTSTIKSGVEFVKALADIPKEVVMPEVVATPKVKPGTFRKTAKKEVAKEVVVADNELAAFGVDY